METGSFPLYVCMHNFGDYSINGYIINYNNSDNHDDCNNNSKNNNNNNNNNNKDNSINNKDNYDHMIKLDNHIGLKTLRID